MFRGTLICSEQFRDAIMFYSTKWSLMSAAIRLSAISIWRWPSNLSLSLPLMKYGIAINNPPKLPSVLNTKMKDPGSPWARGTGEGRREAGQVCPQLPGDGARGLTPTGTRAGAVGSSRATLQALPPSAVVCLASRAKNTSFGLIWIEKTIQRL